VVVTLTDVECDDVAAAAKQTMSCHFQRISTSMAIANGTCVSFCNQPKAHFGLPWVRPWENRGKCHMDEKKDSMLVKCIASCTHLSFQ